MVNDKLALDWAQRLATPNALTLQKLLVQPHDWGTKKAIDLGCGQGVDTPFLLREGWQVMAVDQRGDVYDWLTETVNPVALARLTFIQDSFLNAPLTPCDLINATFSLPFCKSSSAFQTLWGDMKTSLRKGGFFCGQLLGLRDDWHGLHPLVFHSRSEVEALTANFEVIQWLEIEKEAPTVTTSQKQWHVHHLVLRLA